MKEKEALQLSIDTLLEVQDFFYEKGDWQKVCGEKGWENLLFHPREEVILHVYCKDKNYIFDTEKGELYEEPKHEEDFEFMVAYAGGGGWASWDFHYKSFKDQLRETWKSRAVPLYEFEESYKHIYTDRHYHIHVVTPNNLSKIYNKHKIEHEYFPEYKEMASSHPRHFLFQLVLHEYHSHVLNHGHPEDIQDVQEELCREMLDESEHEEFSVFMKKRKSLWREQHWRGPIVCTINSKTGKITISDHGHRYTFE